ncbi:MAG: hypothetical protein IJ492_05840, partial [Clostridia bacterium]|nr:hypothetical protein [Clostridia bacterium]
IKNVSGKRRAVPAVTESGLGWKSHTDTGVHCVVCQVDWGKRRIFLRKYSSSDSSVTSTQG